MPKESPVRPSLLGRPPKRGTPSFASPLADRPAAKRAERLAGQIGDPKQFGTTWQNPTAWAFGEAGRQVGTTLGLEPATPLPELPGRYPLFVPQQTEGPTALELRRRWEDAGWGGPRGAFAVPTINDPRERVANILADLPARFDFNPDHDADASSPLWEAPIFGRIALAGYDPLIEAASRRHHIDADLLRAIMWMENARGHKFGFNYLLDEFGDTKFPMNINPDLWANLLGSRNADLTDPEQNIEAAAILIGRMAARLDHPTPEAIGSIWNYIGRETTNDIGAYVGRVYRERPWSRPLWSF